MPFSFYHRARFILDFDLGYIFDIIIMQNVKGKLLNHAIFTRKKFATSRKTYVITHMFFSINNSACEYYWSSSFEVNYLNKKRKL